MTEVLNKAARDQFHSAAMTYRDHRVTIEKIGKASRDDATKFSKAGEFMEPDLLARIIVLMHGTRRIRAFGIFYRLPALEIDPDPTDELKTGELCECGACLQVDRVSRWLSNVSHYALKLRSDPDLPDLALEVIQTLAAIGLSSKHEKEAGAVWYFIWQDNPTIPLMHDYAPFSGGNRAPPALH